MALYNVLLLAMSAEEGLPCGCLSFLGKPLYSMLNDGMFYFQCSMQDTENYFGINRYKGGYMCNGEVFSLNIALEAYTIPTKWLTIFLILSILTVKNRLINCEGRKSYECAYTQIHTVYTYCILKILSSFKLSLWGCSII